MPDANSWLMLSVPQGGQYAGNDGYPDDPPSTYAWDSTVYNHDRPREGDLIALWDRAHLLGVSRIQRIETDSGTKERYRCPSCKKTGFKERVRLSPRYRCPSCKSEFDQPVTEPVSITTFRSQHAEAWIDLDGVGDAAGIRNCCLYPRSQHSIREIDWAQLAEHVGPLASASIRRLGTLGTPSPSGHRKAMARVRIGQGAGRRERLARTRPSRLGVRYAGHDRLEVGEHLPPLLARRRRRIWNDYRGLLQLSGTDGYDLPRRTSQRNPRGRRRCHRLRRPLRHLDLRRLHVQNL